MTPPVPRPSFEPRWRLVALVLLLTALVGLAIAWKWSPLRGWLDVDRIVAGLRQLGATYGPAAAVGGFALASALAVPVTFLALVTLVAYGPVAGFCCTMAGAMLGSAASYGIGRFLGREAIERMAGPRMKQLSQRLAQRGLWAIATVRIVPVAPFAIVNMVAGASRIRLRDMVFGTALGMAPGTLIMVFFVDRIVEAIRHPGLLTLGLALLGLALIVVGGWGLRRWLKQARSEERQGLAQAQAQEKPAD